MSHHVFGISILFYCVSKGSDGKVLEMSTLGHQPVVLGGFFSAVEDEFLPGMALWTSDDVNNHKTVINHPKQMSEWTSHQTMEEKLEMFDIDVRGSISVDLRSAKIKAEGSYKYLSQKEVRANRYFLYIFQLYFLFQEWGSATLGVLHYISETKTETLDPDMKDDLR